MLYSIVLPTRNRPDILRHNLYSLLNQGISNIEIIVSDNGTTALCDEVFREIVGGDTRFHYVRPKEPLDIYSHHEFALSFATGDYVTILEDKKIFRKDTIKIIDSVCSKYMPEMISYDRVLYYPDDGRIEHGKYSILSDREEWHFFDPDLELKRMLKFEDCLYDPQHFVYGQILWGFYKKELIENIIKIFSSFFRNVYSFDTGCKLIALYLSRTKKCIHYDKPLLIDVLLPGRGANTYDYNFLKDTYDNEVPNEEMKKTVLEFISEEFVNSWFYVAKEYQWIINYMESKGYSWENYSLCEYGVIANIRFSVFDRPINNIPSKIYKKQKEIIKEATRRLSLIKRIQLLKVYAKLKYGNLLSFICYWKYRFIHALWIVINKWCHVLIVVWEKIKKPSDESSNSGNDQREIILLDELICCDL